MFVSSNKQKNNLCESSQQTTNSKALTMPRQLGIFVRRDSINKLK